MEEFSGECLSGSRENEPWPDGSSSGADLFDMAGDDLESDSSGYVDDPDPAVLIDRLDRFLELCRSIDDTPSSLLEDRFFENDAGHDDAVLPDDLDELQKSLRLLSYYSAVSDGDPGTGATQAAQIPNGGDFKSFRPEGPVFVSGRFLLSQMIGRGSYGIVYRAFDMVAQREVALKMPRPELRGIRTVMRRFYREGTSIGKVVHPGLVPLLDMGLEAGIPYLVTRLVKGPNLEQWLIQTNGELSFRLAAIWGEQLAEAVDHLHKKSIVHGDLKPSNILLEHPYEEESLDLPPEMLSIRVTDFGNASMIRESASGQGERIQGTLCFMAPEQLAPEFRSDARSDVYAICAIIYELIAGRPLFESTETRSLETAIRQSLPVPLRAIRPDTPFALQAIVMKGLSKRPEDRYRNAGELAREINAWRNLRTPEVLRNHKHRQLALWLIRNRFVISVIMMSLMIVTALALVRAYESKISERLALRRETNAWWSGYVDKIGVASRYLEMNSERQVRDLLEGLSQWPPELQRKDDPREFAWHYLKNMSRDRSRVVQEVPREVMHLGIAVDPLGNRVFAGGTDGHLRVLDARSERLIGDHVIQNEPILALAVAPDGLTIAVSDPKGTIRLLDAETFMILDSVEAHSDEVTCLLFTPDSNVLLSTSMDGFLAKYDLRDRSVSKTGLGNSFGAQPGQPLHGLALLSDGKRVAVAQSNNRIRIYDLDSGDVVRTMAGHFGEVHQVVLSGNRKWLVSTGSDRTLGFWDPVMTILRNQVEVGSKFNYVKPAVGGHSKVRKVRALATITDAEGLDMVAVDVDDGHIKLIEVPSGTEIGQLVGNYGHVMAMSWSPVHRKLFVSTNDGVIRVWQAPFVEHSIHSDSFELGPGPGGTESAFFIDVDHEGVTRWEGGQTVQCVTYDTSCFRIDRTASADNGRIWGAISKRVDRERDEAFVEFRVTRAPGPDFTSDKQIEWRLIETHKVNRRRAAPSLKAHPTRPYFLVLDSDGRVTHFDFTDPRNPQIRSIEREIDFASFRPDSDDVLMIHSGFRKISFWNFRTDVWAGLPIDAPLPEPEFVMASFPKLLNTILLARVGGILEFRDLRTGRVLKTIYLPEIKSRRIRDVVFSADNSRMFVAMGFQDLFLIDVPTGKILQNWVLEDREIVKIALSSDGRSFWVLESMPDVEMDVKVHLTLRRIRRFFAPGMNVSTSSTPFPRPADDFENVRQNQ